MMTQLNDKEWGELRIENLFEVSRPAARNKDNYQNGDIPFVASGSVNNGVMKLCAPNGKENLDKGNCITVSPVDGSTFYQPADFLGRGGAGSSILMLRNDTLTPYQGQFIASAIKQTCSKYTYGHMGNKDSIKRERIMLPVANDGEPDYDYMSDYVREHKEEMLAKYRDYAEKRIAEIGDYFDIPALDEKEWDKFSAFGEDGFFEIATTSSSIDGIRIIDGDDKKVPYVTRTDTNNGIARFVSDNNYDFGYDKAGCITVGLDTQSAFWQSSDFITGQNIQVITSDILNPYLAQFVIPLFKSQMNAKFNWGGNGATLGRMKRLELMLPVNDSGKPDFEYMEQYAKNMMLRKYKQYLAFLGNQEGNELGGGQ